MAEESQSLTARAKRTSNGKALIGAALILFLAMGAGLLRYRGPAPLDSDATTDRPSAARMRQTLGQLLGDPPQIHKTATAGGEAFLQRLEAHIDALGVTHRRIEIPFDPEQQGHHPKGRIDLLPDGVILKNLLATVPGQDPSLAPILVATHHDSCRWGPGAGDAGSGVVTLLEHMRILAKSSPRRTTHYLFSDGEEFGLLGAYSLATLPELPFREPVFVLNFDARGTSGGVPMFETHDGNLVAVNRLINDLAEPGSRLRWRSRFIARYPTQPISTSGTKPFTGQDLTSPSSAARITIIAPAIDRRILAIVRSNTWAITCSPCTARSTGWTPNRPPPCRPPIPPRKPPTRSSLTCSGSL